MLLLTYPINQIFLTRNWRTCFAGRFSENLSGGPLNLKNSFTWGIALIVGRRYWIHHWFGVYLAITSYSSRVWRRVVDAIHGEYFDNSK
jgi:hypothetical protein